MIFQQRIRLTATPLIQQDVPTSVLSLIRRFYLDRMEQFNTESAEIRRIDYENHALEGENTYVDMVVTVEASTVDFFDLFLKSFLRRDSTYPFRLIHHDFVGM